jgi:hypothetical protein
MNLKDKIKKSDDVYFEYNQNRDSNSKADWFIIPLPEMNGDYPLGILVYLFRYPHYMVLKGAVEVEPNQEYTAGLWRPPVEYTTSDLNLEDIVEEYDSEVKGYLPESLLE